MEWDRPSRTDNYLMMIGAEIRRIPRTLFNKNPNAVQPRHMRLRFVDSSSGEQLSQKPISEMTEEELKEAKEKASAIANQVWRARLGGAGLPIKDKDGNVVYESQAKQRREVLEARQRVQTKSKYTQPPPKPNR